MDGGRDGGREGARDDACVDGWMDGWMDVCTVGIGSLHGSPCIVADAGPEAMNQTRDTTGKKGKAVFRLVQIHLKLQEPTLSRTYAWDIAIRIPTQVGFPASGSGFRHHSWRV